MLTIDDLAAILKTTPRNAVARIIKLKLGPMCARCGGSGRYSYNAFDGDRCYGCHGAGIRMPKTANEWAATKAAAEIAVTSGELARYVANLEAQGRCKNGMKRAFDAWHDLDAINGYSKNWQLKTLSDDCRRRNETGVTLVDRLRALDKGPETDWLAYEQALTEGLAAIAAAKAELMAETK